MESFTEVALIRDVFTQVKHSDMNELGDFTCVGTAETCDDLQPCTDDVCSCDDGVKVCTNEAVEDGTECDYSPNDCTTGDSCASGQCILSPPLDLDDDNPCTEDTCEKGEVVHTFLLTGQCDDGDECTVLGPVARDLCEWHDIDGMGSDDAGLENCRTW